MHGSTPIRRIFLLFIVTIAAAAVFGVMVVRRNMAPATSPATDNLVHVTTSFYPLYYFASEIGGDRASVINITPAGAEPHDYEPSAQDIARMGKSQLLILNGNGLEVWSGQIEQNLDPSRTIIITAGKGLATERVQEQGQDILDPHVWLDPKRAEQMVEKIADGFVRADPLNADFYHMNADNLKTRLEALDREYADGLRDCAEKNVVTSHAAFGYLAASYGFQQVSIAGLSPDAEPSSRVLTGITDFVRAHQIRYIFFEELVSPKFAETIAHETGAQTLVLNSLEGLSKNDIAQGKDYFTVMRSNLVHLQTALACQK